jgi:Zn-dependent peptidase ImmA (M78 family)
MADPPSRFRAESEPSNAPEAARRRIGAYVSPEIIEMVRVAFAATQRSDLVDEGMQPERPFVDIFSPAVAMFGGVSPHLNQADIESLGFVLVSTAGGVDTAELAKLVSGAGSAPFGFRPHEDGYRLAEELLEAINEPGDADFVDVRSICERLTIRVIERPLATDTIRGVALAGEGFSPTILVNTTSIFNVNDSGRRFTIAHELCHVLYDRSRARRVAHVSGPWVAPGIEKRANAFGAYLLMPRSLVLRLLGGGSSLVADRITQVADLLQVNETPLIEHLYNIDLITESDRERLRAGFPAPNRSVVHFASATKAVLPIRWNGFEHNYCPTLSPYFACIAVEGWLSRQI